MSLNVRAIAQVEPPHAGRGPGKLKLKLKLKFEDVDVGPDYAVLLDRTDYKGSSLKNVGVADGYGLYGQKAAVQRLHHRHHLGYAGDVQSLRQARDHLG